MTHVEYGRVFCNKISHDSESSELLDHVWKRADNARLMRLTECSTSASFF